MLVDEYFVYDYCAAYFEALGLINPLKAV